MELNEQETVLSSNDAQEFKDSMGNLDKTILETMAKCNNLTIETAKKILCKLVKNDHVLVLELLKAEEKEKEEVDTDNKEEEWKDFLNKYNLPLLGIDDEKDDDADPEYISKNELSVLISQLFEDSNLLLEKSS